MNMTRVLTLALALLPTFSAQSAVGRQEQRFPAYTLVQRIVFVDAKGDATTLGEMTLYASSGGDWRRVWSYDQGPSLDTIFLLGKGVFYTDQRGHRLLLIGAERTGYPGHLTAERLQSDPKFVRTEYVSGFLTYVKREEIDGYTYEHYYAPELGPFPIKTVLSHDGYKKIDEPVSIVFGEPETAHLRNAEYALDEQRQTFDKDLADRLVVKPEPQLPQNGAGLAGEKVTVQVYVDEAGYVLRAAMVSGHPLLEGAAIRAAFGARFTPKNVAGGPVKSMGLITCEFPAARTSSH